MRVSIKPSAVFSTTVTLPPSKSILIRSLIAAALADGTSCLTGFSPAALCGDVRATIDFIKAFGATVTEEENGVTVKSGKRPGGKIAFDARGSATLLRLALPILAALGIPATCRFDPALAIRPIDPLLKVLSENGVTVEKGDLSISVSGKLAGGLYTLPGNVSSQFVTAFLYALPLTAEGGAVAVLPPADSASYIEMTREVLEEFGVDSDAAVAPDGTLLFAVPGGQTYLNTDYTVEQDASAKIYFDALAILAKARLDYAGENSFLQGDTAELRLLFAVKGEESVIDLCDNPDLAPMLFAFAAMQNHPTSFRSFERLRTKESDRVAAMQKALAAFGVRVSISDGTLTVFPPEELLVPTEVLDGCGDHRIVMALSVLASTVGADISGCEAVCKSFPAFFDELGKAGISLTLSEE